MSDENFFRQFVQSGRFSRRELLIYFSALSSIPFIQSTYAVEKINFAKNPFSLGVASGDPDHKSLVLWTKLALEPLEIGGGMPQTVAVEVKWEIADDEKFSKIVQQGVAIASPELGHTLHIEVDNLKENSWYFYRFYTGQYSSEIGRTRTMPNTNVLPENLRFAMTSCQNFEEGYFTAYRQMIVDQVDLVIHLGDYIYEMKGRDNYVRKHLGNELVTLDDYRRRYAQYRTDRLLQQIHAFCPWVVTWDDHEFENNYANDISQFKTVDKASFLLRRAAAYQAYYEMMPLRKTSVPQGANLLLYREINFGQLAKFLVLDTRQYRTDQPNSDGKKPLTDESRSNNNSLLGLEQKLWMYKSLDNSKAIWNILAQQVMMGMVDIQSEVSKGALYSMDQWPGYSFERQAILRYMSEKMVKNPVVLTGDIHSNWVNELRLDDFKPETNIIATEFVTTSLSASGNGTEGTKVAERLKSRNPCVKFYNGQRGYVLCELTPKWWKSYYKVVDKVTVENGTVSVKAAFVVEEGIPKVNTL